MLPTLLAVESVPPTVSDASPTSGTMTDEFALNEPAFAPASMVLTGSSELGDGTAAEKSDPSGVAFGLADPAPSLSHRPSSLVERCVISPPVASIASTGALPRSCPVGKTPDEKFPFDASNPFSASTDTA